MSEETINIPERIHFFNAITYIRQAHAALYDDSVSKEIIQKYTENAIKELDKVSNTVTEWEKLFFKIANKIR